MIYVLIVARFKRNWCLQEMILQGEEIIRDHVVPMQYGDQSSLRSEPQLSITINTKGSHPNLQRPLPLPKFSKNLYNLWFFLGL